MFEYVSFKIFHLWGAFNTDTLLHSGSLNQAAKQEMDYKVLDLTITLFLCDKLDLLNIEICCRLNTFFDRFPSIMCSS